MNSLKPGLVILHSHRLETLRDTLVEWMATHPISSPLGIEDILVQSNGVAQWLKIALAESSEHAHISAGLKMELPSQFVWKIYRVALGDQIPESLPYDKANLLWRIMQLLPQLADDVYLPLQSYIEDDYDGRKRYQLAARLADLYDQYQIYRSDWLNQWQKGKIGDEVPDDQQWQPELWQRIFADIRDGLSENGGFQSAARADCSRADIHGDAMQAIKDGNMVSRSRIPERVIVFGVTSLPQQVIELLATLGEQTQVMLFVLNPCRYYWGDITLLKDEVRKYRRHQRKEGQPASLDIEAMHLHAPPLLASMGKQVRDYISLLDGYDQPEQYQSWYQGGRIDLFDAEEAVENPSLLEQIQDDILNLEPPPTTQRLLDAGDRSVTFHSNYSCQRELEVLQDKLIEAFAEDAALKPRDIIIMVPDIENYGPHIEAVFGRISFEDDRHIPYSVTDQNQRGHNPLLIALEYLLKLPQQRITFSEVLELIDVPAIQRRFNINIDAMDAIRLWSQESGVRWGLDRSFRDALQQGSMGKDYSWTAGIERMLLGYAMGEQQQAWQGTLPYSDVGGLSAADLGPLIQLLESMQRLYHSFIQHPQRRVSNWYQNFSELLDHFFDFNSDSDRRLGLTLREALKSVDGAATAGGFSEEIPLMIIRDVWLGQVDDSGLSQSFMAGKVTFSTLMPMRAIPFRQIYLLGMNDSDYPRSNRPDDFDLMRNSYRPGDRSRRDDDRYLFLEAILSAREKLSISWLGRSIHDNSEKTASVVVSQLRDVIEQSWNVVVSSAKENKSLLDHLTIEYPLQPFSRQYFTKVEGADQQQTYAFEWQPSQVGKRSDKTLSKLDEKAFPSLSVNQLASFLKSPVAYFLNQRFDARMQEDATLSKDEEPFDHDGLEQWQLGQDILIPVIEQGKTVAEATNSLQLQGRFRTGGFAQIDRDELTEKALKVTEQMAADHLELWQRCLEPLRIDIQRDGWQLQDWLDGLYQKGDDYLQIEMRTGNISDRRHTLLRVWVKQLVANAQGIAPQTWQYGIDAAIKMPVIAQDEAREQLEHLVQYWREGINRPLPVDIKTALVWLEHEPAKRESKAKEAYEGGFNISGQRENNPELKRDYFDFDTLMDHGFPDWAEQLYGPLQRWGQPQNSNGTDV